MPIECLSAGILFADVACAPIARMPAAGELIPTERMQLGMGGCASNVAVDLAKLGVEVGVSGCVGDDPFGRFLVDTLAEQHVDTRGVHRLAGQGSGSTMIVNVDGEDRRFVSTPGANTRFAHSHIPQDWAQEAKVLYVGGFLIMPELETDALCEMFRAARKRGATTVLDVVLFGRPEYWTPLERILPEVDVFLPNIDEAKVITGLSDPWQQAARFRDAGAGSVVITCGGDGSVLVSEREQLKTGTYATDFVGGAGSGDAFDAGYIMGILQGEDAAGCLRWGSALGASCVRAIGATEGVFTRSEAEAFMERNQLPIESR